MTRSVAEFAAATGVSEQRVRELARAGKLPAERRGKSWVILAAPNERTRPRRRPLSRASQDALITYLDTLSLRHVSGHARLRLAARLRALKAAEHPAELLREYFADRTELDGRGAIALIRTAMLGNDEQAEGSLAITPPRNLINAERVADALYTLRLIQDRSAADVAEAAGASVDEYRKLEAGKPVQHGNLIAGKAFQAMNYSPGRIKTGETLYREAA